MWNLCPSGSSYRGKYRRKQLKILWFYIAGNEESEVFNKILELPKQNFA